MTGRPSARAWLARPELWLAVILILATALRIAWVANAARPPQGLHDPTLYHLYAQQIAQGNGYHQLTRDQLREINPLGYREAVARGAVLPNGEPTAYYPVGYPATIGALYFVLIHTPLPDDLVQANAYLNVFLSVATVALAYVVGRRLFNPWVGLLAAGWLAFFPNLVFHTALFLTETLFNFLVMAALAVLLWRPWRATRDGERRIGAERLVFFGLLLGASIMVRPISALFLPALALVLLVYGFGWRRALGHAAVAFAATAAVILPWTVRNVIVMDAPIVLSTNVGDNLCIGHNPSATGAFSFAEVETADYCNFDLARRYTGLSRDEAEVQRNSDNTRTAIEFALKHPGRELELLARKAYYTWADNDHDGLFAAESYGRDRFLDPDVRSLLAKTADSYFYFTISVGGLGVLLLFVVARLQGERLTLALRAPEDRTLFLVLALLSLAGVPLIFFGDARFHVPALPLLVLPAAWLGVSVAQAAARLASGPRSVEEVAEGGASVTEHDAL